MFQHDPKFIYYKKAVAKLVKRDSGVALSYLTEPYPGMLEGNYCLGISPEITAMDIIEVNVGLGNIS